jgi:hypothetical protein
MTQDEIIEITKQAALHDNGESFLEKFAKLVAAKEQKEMIDLVAFYGGNVYDIQTAIRARGEA